MASTYVNNLRLNEMATGDASGTWGTTTNTNLELIGEALGYGTEAITTNADTHTSTVADGASDAARAMYIKYTGTLDSTCTITISPNTMKRVQIIENATSGSQSIIISQGSGANVTIPTGKVAVVYLDGAGSGAAVVNAFTDLDLAGTLGVAGISSSGAIVPSASDGAALGSASLEWSDLFLADGAVINLGDDQDTTLTHVADTGILLNSTRQLQFGDSGTYIHQSADGVLDLVSDTEIEINATTIDINGAVDISGNALVSGEVQTANIGFTDGDNAITIADGGGITAAAGITSTAAANTFGATSFNEADLTNVGTVYADQYLGDADTDSGIVLPGSNIMTLHTNNAERMRISESGCVGVGSTSDRSIGTNIGTLVVNGSAGGGLWLSTGDSSATTSKIYAANNGSVGELIINNGTGVGSGGIMIQTNGTERIRIQSNGRVGVGTTGGNAGITCSTDIRAAGASFGNDANTITMSYESAGAYVTSRGANTSTRGTLGLSVNRSNGAAGISGVWVANDGYLNVGKTDSDYETDGCHFITSGTYNGTMYSTLNSSGGSSYHLRDSTNDAWRFYVEINGTISATSTSISSLSDERLKENIKDLEIGLDEIMALKPRRFDWKEGQGNKQKNVAGFIAQEVEPILPDLIGDFMHDDLDDAKSVKMGDMIPTLVKAIQEQQTQIDALQSEIKTLKGE